MYINEECYYLSTERFNIDPNNIMVITDTDVLKDDSRKLIRVVRMDPDINEVKKVIKRFFIRVSLDARCISPLDSYEVFFYISSHGKKTSKEENALIMKDKKNKVYLTSSEANELIFGEFETRYNCLGIPVSVLPLNVNILCIVDACHSENILDLQYIFKDNRFADVKGETETAPYCVCISSCNIDSTTPSCNEGSPFTHYIYTSLLQQQNELNIKDLNTIMNSSIYKSIIISPMISSSRLSSERKVPLL